MIICSASNIDLIQGTLGYGDNTEGVNITDWRISNTQSAIAGQSGVFNIFNSSSITPSISIVDSGTVGIGTVPSVSSASKMEIVGNVNITGAYNINNRNVIADTSNYILSTSNILLERINANSGGGSGSLTSGGNLTLSNNATSNTVLSIANSNVVYGTIQGTSNYTSNVVTGTAFVATFADANVPSTHAAVSSSTDRYMIFTTASSNHTFTVPAGGLVCDILMIGGGGIGYNGGAGAGACIVAINQTLPAGSCVVNVGAGSSTYFLNGSDSYITVGGFDRYRAKGGGSSLDYNANVNPGGCGGGPSRSTDNTPRTGGAVVSTNVVNGSLANIGPSITSTYAVMGNAGGSSDINNSGSGGGIGTAGTTGGKGGNGAYQVTLTTSPTTTINFRNYFANGGTFGVQDGTTSNYYIGGGGGGFTGSYYQAGGLGGGGGTNNAITGVANTGSGGGGAGASGIIIIRYRSVSTTTTSATLSTPITIPTATLGTPTIELIRGTQGDNNLDYKLGNYDGNFKIMSSISNTDTDRLSISSSGAISLSNNATSNTVLSIQNNFTSNYTSNYTSNVVTVSGTPFTATFADANVPSTHAQVTDTPNDRYMIFTTANVNHTFTVPTGGLNCDILMIGGGGGAFAGGSCAGGGAGACIVAINQTLPAGSCVVNVGVGGTSSANSTNGGDSFIQVDNTDRYRAKGGGAGGGNSGDLPGLNGGCGGGASYNYNTITDNGGQPVITNVITLNNSLTSNIGHCLSSNFAVLGNAGGNNGSVSGKSGSGGGIGASGITGGTGGDGAYQITLTGAATPINFRNYFANGGTFGVLNSADSQYYIGGGGGGYKDVPSPAVFYNGGLGGGGGNTAVAFSNTGGGGGSITTTGLGCAGGSGIIIIRYRSGTSTTTPTAVSSLLSTPPGTPTIELIRGTQGDSNTDYKIGNYNGDFIVKSSVSSVDSDYIRMLGTNGAIYNFTNSLYWTQTSDRRIKENIARASYDMCYDNIDKLELNRFNYIKEFNTGNKDTNQLGFIAQEIKEIFPKAVFTNNYSGGDLNIQDMLSIDIGQINYTLYGAVKKLMEINKDKEMRLKRLEGLLNIEDGSGSSGNVVIDSSNVVVDSSNVVVDTSNLLDTSSNITIDTSNLLDTPNITIDTSNITIDTSNILDTSRNITIDTSNLLDTPNITIDTSNLLDTSNIVIDTSNLLDTSNITIDTSNLLDTSSNI